MRCSNLFEKRPRILLHQILHGAEKMATLGSIDAAVIEDECKGQDWRRTIFHKTDAEDC
jgi:hypothetical protein